jgi:hypothetical protein|nr:hypothetical protein [Neorhizobium tomejilense]
MKKLEGVYTEATQVLLLEGKSDAAVSWGLEDDSVVLFDKEKSVIARGPLGAVGQAVLPKINRIEVFSVFNDRIRDVKWLVRQVQ